MGFKFSFCWAYVFVLLTSGLANSAVPNDQKTYVVYMGSSRDEGRDSLVRSHVELLSSVLGSRSQAQESLIHSYTYAFTGFSAVLSDEQAKAMAEKEEVVSVFPDPVLNIHTTQSWDFLLRESPMAGGSIPNPSSSDKDAIVGLLDTGIWPEAASFSDNGIESVPSRWKGACMQGEDFTVSNCNNKLIGARYYKQTDSDGNNPSPIWTKSMTPRDSNGHGTHTASTAAGNIVPNANYHGLVNGTARGGSTTSRIAMYRVCSEDGCLGSHILAAFDDAVQDGVDILSISLGHSGFIEVDYVNDPIAIGSFHATQKGILVVCSAGNDGPNLNTVVNAAPWILTVGASTIDREFGSNVILGNGKTLQGIGINLSNLSLSAVYPLVYGGSIPSNSSSPVKASNCNPRALDGTKVKDKVVLCLNGDTSYSRTAKQSIIQNMGGIGMILVDDSRKSLATNYGTFPATTVTNKTATEIFSYIDSESNPLATITPTEVIKNYKPAPVVAYFSSRGPGGLTENILKPDIIAPGVNILAAWIAINETSSTNKSVFNLISGTSMACPHVSGVAAFLKTTNPAWTSSAIKSALITTANSVTNTGSTITDDSEKAATPFDIGSGEVNPVGALQPGLIYETSNEEYFHFLCYSGLDSQKIKLISGKEGYMCPSDAKEDYITNINYPSIAISKFEVNGSTTVSRTLTYMSPSPSATEESVYSVKVEGPPWLNVKVSPESLIFSKTTSQLSFNVTFTAEGEAAAKGYAFGSLTWSDTKNNVRTPFAVNIV